MCSFDESILTGGVPPIIMSMAETSVCYSFNRYRDSNTLGVAEKNQREGPAIFVSAYLQCAEIEALSQKGP